MKGQVSVNFTLTYKVELLNFAKFEFEFEMTPVLLSLATDLYSTSMLGDNCLWTYYNWHTLYFNTRFTKTFRQCGYNFKKFVDRADSILDIPATILNTPFGDQFYCDYDDLFGVDTQTWNLVSGSLADLIPIDIVKNLLNRDDYVLFSYCLGSLDWAGYLIPSGKGDKQS